MLQHPATRWQHERSFSKRFPQPPPSLPPHLLSLHSLRHWNSSVCQFDGPNAGHIEQPWPEDLWSIHRSDEIYLVLFRTVGSKLSQQMSAIWAEVGAALHLSIGVGVIDCHTASALCQRFELDAEGSLPAVLLLGPSIELKTMEIASESSPVPSVGDVVAFAMQIFMPPDAASDFRLKKLLAGTEEAVLVVCPSASVDWELCRDRLSQQILSSQAQQAELPKILMLDCSDPAGGCNGVELPSDRCVVHIRDGTVRTILSSEDLDVTPDAVVRAVERAIFTLPPLAPSGVPDSAMALVLTDASVDEDELRTAVQTLERARLPIVRRVDCEAAPKVCRASQRLPAVQVVNPAGREEFPGDELGAGGRYLRRWLLSARSRMVYTLTEREMLAIQAAENSKRRWVVLLYDSRHPTSPWMLARFREAAEMTRGRTNIIWRHDKFRGAKGRHPMNEGMHAYGLEDFNFGAVDCARERAMCTAKSSEGPLYRLLRSVPRPTYLYFGGGGGPEANVHTVFPEELVEDMRMAFEPPLVLLDHQMWTDRVIGTEAPWLVVFGDGPWCSPNCTAHQRHVLKLALRVQGFVLRGYVNCARSRELCQAVTPPSTAPDFRLVTGKIGSRSNVLMTGDQYNTLPGLDKRVDELFYWVTSNSVPDRLTRLSPALHYKRVQDGVHNTVVLYTHGRSHNGYRKSKALFTHITYLLRHEPISVGIFDCVQHSAVCGSLDWPPSAALPVQGVLYPKREMAGSDQQHIAMVMPLDAGLTAQDLVAWIRTNSHAATFNGDPRTVAVLRAFYGYFDRRGKTDQELAAIAHRYRGKEKQLFDSLERTYGSHPDDVMQTLDPALTFSWWERLLGGGPRLGPLWSSSAFLMLPHDVWLCTAGALVVAVVAEALLGHDRRIVLPRRRERMALVIGAAGSVGCGVAAAFRRAGWTVLGVDPRFRGTQAFDGTSDDMAETVESLPDVWLQERLERCRCVVYAADEDTERFTEFCSRLRRLVRWGASDLPILHVGGSWRRRAVPPDGVIDDGVPAVDEDESELARELSAAEANARAQATAHRLQVHFFDCTDLAPDSGAGPVGRQVEDMVQQALGPSGTISFAGGDCGAPMLHADDAGELLVRFVERGSPGARGTPRLHLVPGKFVSNRTVAEVVRATVMELEVEHRYGGAADEGDDAPPRAIELAEQQPPQRQAPIVCHSALAVSLGIDADSSNVRAGLATACIQAWHRARE